MGMPPLLMTLRRRALLALVAIALLPRAARAQRAPAPHRIGWLSTEQQPDPFLDGFREGLRKHGYVEGQNVVLELRYPARSLEAVQAAVTELMQARVAFIVASGPAIRALEAAKDAWVLFVVSGDPVELGVAKSLARPGGNFTGSTFLSLEIAGKRIELLKQAVPELRTLAALSNTDHPGEGSERRATEAAAQALGITTAYVPFRQFPLDTTGGDLDRALDAVGRARPNAMVVFPDGATMANRAKIAQFAIAQRLPSMFGWGEYCDAGGLMSYGANQRAAYIRLAAFADKLLHGAKPADLPIEQPTRFELILNLRTAKRLGVTIPPLIVQRADRLIE
jgi:putative ABC transport system substrate-binding protein